MNQITAVTKLCILIGDPVEHSLSPVIHNAGYQATGLAGNYVYLAMRVLPGHVEDAVAGIRSLGIRGVSCTLPHKLMVMQYLDEIDPVARKIGAVNTIVNEKGKLFGYNTDWLGTIKPLAAIVGATGPVAQYQASHRLAPTKYPKLLLGKSVALIGAGGAARAIAYAVQHLGGRLTIFNRTLDKAVYLADEFSAQAKPLSQIKLVKDMDVIVNSTSIGMNDSGVSPLPSDLLNSKQIVFDAIYSPLETKLLADAKKAGARTIHGTEMLLHQGTAQFELFTGQPAPEATMRQALLDKLKK